MTRVSFLWGWEEITSRVGRSEEGEEEERGRDEAPALRWKGQRLGLSEKRAGTGKRVHIQCPSWGNPRFRFSEGFQSGKGTGAS